MDGFTLVVEARVGGCYRTYKYWITDDKSPWEQDATHRTFGISLFSPAVLILTPTAQVGLSFTSMRRTD
jgi:hypothetical protein